MFKGRERTFRRAGKVVRVKVILMGGHPGVASLRSTAKQARSLSEGPKLETHTEVLEFQS